MENNTTETLENVADLARSIERDMLDKYGPMISGDALREVLGYPSLNAMRQAVSRGTIPIPIFSIEKRRGKFALVKEVALWIAKQRLNGG